MNKTISNTQLVTESSEELKTKIAEIMRGGREDLKAKIAEIVMGAREEKNMKHAISIKESANNSDSDGPLVVDIDDESDDDSEGGLVMDKGEPDSPPSDSESFVVNREESSDSESDTSSDSESDTPPRRGGEIVDMHFNSVSGGYDVDGGWDDLFVVGDQLSSVV